MVDIILIPESEETLICLLHMVRDLYRIALNFNDRRIVIRVTVYIRITARIHVVVHGLRILGHTVTQNRIDFVVLIYLEKSEIVKCHDIQTVDQMAGLNLYVLGERLTAVLQELFRADAALHMCGKIVGDILPVRHSVMISTELVVKPDRIRDTGHRTYLICTARIITVDILKHLDSCNILLIRRTIRLGEVVARNPGSVHDACRILGVANSVIGNRARRVVRRKAFRKYGL